MLAFDLTIAADVAAAVPPATDDGTRAHRRGSARVLAPAARARGVARRRDAWCDGVSARAARRP
jgi:hypothetical protein